MVLFRHSFSADGVDGYTAADENDKSLGDCRFIYGGYEMKIADITCSDDLLVEGLVRAAMNYCANRNMYICSVTADLLCPALIRLGFSESRLTVEIPEALTSSCCKCGK